MRTPFLPAALAALLLPLAAFAADAAETQTVALIGESQNAGRRFFRAVPRRRTILTIQPQNRPTAKPQP